MNIFVPRVELVATVLFALAVLHTFVTQKFAVLAHRDTQHAGLWHLLGEIEAVFGIWALILICWISFTGGATQAVDYLEGLNYTEPMFVFVIMVIAASRPILQLCQMLLQLGTKILPVPTSLATYFLCLSFVPLLGSFITEPAAMTLAALLLRDTFYSKGISDRCKYATLGVLFVNVSIGGTLTPYAAPPVLMVAAKWGWDINYMLMHIGYKALIAVIANSVLVTIIFAKELKSFAVELKVKRRVPWVLIVLHLLMLMGVVVFAHHPVLFMGLFLVFLGVAEAYKRHQNELVLREGLMVALFLAGLVTLGSLQQWWLDPVLRNLDTQTLFFGAVALTAITDNAALTYLGSMVEGVDSAFKYALVTGAVTGGGLTIIANAPNPAGVAVLKNYFDDASISAIKLFCAALLPTLIAIAAFKLL